MSVVQKLLPELMSLQLGIMQGEEDILVTGEQPTSSSAHSVAFGTGLVSPLCWLLHREKEEGAPTQDLLAAVAAGQEPAKTRS